MPRHDPARTPWDLPPDDLDAGVAAARVDLDALEGPVLVTGGTGFLGSWIVASLLWAIETTDLDIEVVVLTRDAKRVPLEETRSLRIVEGDVRALPDLGPVSAIVHGAASSSSLPGSSDATPRAMVDTIVDGTRGVLDLAARDGARVLLLSSGAVYGPRIAPVAEDDPGAPDPLDPRSAYGAAKRLAETLGAITSESHGVEYVVARLFAFVGPRIPLDAHYAAGNFVGDALAGRAIIVNGDGGPRRSYMYTGDVPVWLWALFARGRSGIAYNVGSDESVSIAGLARRTARLASPASAVDVRGVATGAPDPWYVPVTERCRDELGLRLAVDLDGALRKTFDWYAARAVSPRGR